MKPHCPTPHVLLILAALLAACDSHNPEVSPSAQATTTQETAASASTEADNDPIAAAVSNNVIELDWDVLIPDDWRLDKLIKLMDEYNADDLSDDDPRAKELMDKIKTFWKEAPVVHKYDGKTVTLPGFVVPLEMDAKTIDEFLLVPYYGACIHTPPPPANQTVHVVTDREHAYQGQLFDTVWVTGTFKVEKLSSELGDAGYRIEARSVKPYP